MTFQEIVILVAQGNELHKSASLTERSCFLCIKSLNYQYRNKVITKDQATREKHIVSNKFEEQKRHDLLCNNIYTFHQDNIKRFGEIRNNLNKASANQNIDKQLWLEAIECIGLVCGEMTSYRCCERYFNGFELEV